MKKIKNIKLSCLGLSNVFISQKNEKGHYIGPTHFLAKRELFSEMAIGKMKDNLFETKHIDNVTFNSIFKEKLKCYEKTNIIVEQYKTKTRVYRGSQGELILFNEDIVKMFKYPKLWTGFNSYKIAKTNPFYSDNYDIIIMPIRFDGNKTEIKTILKKLGEKNDDKR